MRFLSCQVHCPSVCFCKPSPHIYTSGPLRLQNGPQLPATLVSVSSASDQSPAEITEVKDENLAVAKGTSHHRFKSSLKSATSDLKPQQKKQVQWMDFLGRELAEIREYESSEEGDTDGERGGKEAVSALFFDPAIHRTVEQGTRSGPCCSSVHPRIRL